MGNHDAGAIGAMDLGWFNDLAAWACRWTANQLTQEVRQYLGSLPLTAAAAPFTLVHGTPQDPLREYLVSEAQAIAAWNAVTTPVVLVGHLHRPFVC